MGAHEIKTAIPLSVSELLYLCQALREKRDQVASGPTTPGMEAAQKVRGKLLRKLDRYYADRTCGDYLE